MTSSTLIGKAQEAARRVADASRDVEVATAELHHIIRRLHLEGATLREVAETVGMSHQRVHQIIEGSGGARRWRTSRNHPTQRRCDFCGRGQAEVTTLVAGRAHICGECIRAAGAARKAIGEFLDREIEFRYVPKHHGACGMCRKGGQGEAVTAAGAVICGKCLDLCAEIAGDHVG